MRLKNIRVHFCLMGIASIATDISYLKKIIHLFDDNISMTASQWITALRLVKHTPKIDNEGRKILFVEEIKIR